MRSKNLTGYWKEKKKKTGKALENNKWDQLSIETLSLSRDCFSDLLEHGILNVYRFRDYRVSTCTCKQLVGEM